MTTTTPCPTCGQPWERNTVRVLELPYQRPPLNLNDRMNRLERAVEIQQVRNASAWLCRQARLGTWRRVRVELHWRPGLVGGRPTRRRTRDAENLTATQKAICDGLQDAGLVVTDDHDHMERLQPVIHEVDNTRNGRVWLEVELIDP